MERGKHASYASQRIPVMQLMAKVSTFTGQRKEEHDARIRDFSATTGDIKTEVPSGIAQYTSANPYPPTKDYYQARLNATAPSALDPSYKEVPETTAAAVNVSGYKTNTKSHHAASEVGKVVFTAPDENEMPPIALPGRRMLGSNNVSNEGNAVIGGYEDGDRWQTTAQAAQEGEKYAKGKQSCKKRLTNLQPEDMISPITGNRVADYGTWAEDLKAKQAAALAEEEEESDEDAADEDPLLKKLKTQLNARGAKGILGMGRLFRIMDDDGSNSLSFAEFRKAMKECKMMLSEVELLVLFKRFDKGNTGSISYNNFLTALTGRLNKRRRRLVDMAFNVLDKDGSGLIDMSDIAAAYDVSLHPDFLAGKRTKESILREFLDNFDVGGQQDGVVSKEEFYNYYSTVSCSIQRDDYFELMIRNAWHISGGEGAAANSANRRVLVTRADGSQYVQEITNDLGLSVKDKAGMAARLKAQGVDVANFDLYGAGDDNKNMPPPSTHKPNKKGSKKTSSAPAVKQKVVVEPPPGIKMIIGKIKEEMKSRGSGGFIGLQRRFRIMDDDGSKSLSLAEFKKALKEFKMDLTEADLRALFSFFDADGSGCIDFEEFVQGVREPLSARRLKLVEMAFSVIDRDGSGEVDAQEVAGMYDASKHPEVIARRKTATQVLTEFLDTFDVGGVKDGMVTKQEFVNYYSNLGASIDNEDYFELMIRNAWHLSGGSGMCANTTNMKVLVTDSNGNERTIEVQNDLGLKKDDLAGIYSRLTAQGVKDIRSINGRIVTASKAQDGKEVMTAGGNTAQLTTNDFNIPKVARAPAYQRKGASVPPPAPHMTMSTNQFNGQRSGLAAKVMTQMQKQQEKQLREEEQVIVGNTLLDVLRVQLLSRGAGGIIELQRRFADMDTDGSRSLDYAEFKQALLSNKIAFSEDQLKALFNYFDADGSGAVDYEELLYGLRGQLPPKLLVLVHQIFDLLDKQGVDAIDPTNLITHFDASRHPEVQGRVKTAEQVQKEFLDTFDVGGVRPGLITREEFVRYYTNISAAVNDDDYFDLMLRKVWHINEQVSAESLAAYKNQVTGNVRDTNSLAYKLRAARTMDAAVQRPSSASATRRPSDASSASRAQFAFPGPIPAVNQSATMSAARPVRPQSAGPMGRGRLNSHYVREPVTTAPPAMEAFEPVAEEFSGEVQEEKILLEAREVQRQAVLCYNNQQYAQAEAKFRDVCEVMRMLFPPGHPEVARAEKSVLMVQRKMGAGAGSSRPGTSSGRY